MKPNIHPTYHEATVKCACGNTFTVGSTMPEIKVEICSNCHPFFTGKQKFVDTAGRIDRFKARMKQAEVKKITKKAPVSTSEKTDEVMQSMPQESPDSATGTEDSK